MAEMKPYIKTWFDYFAEGKFMGLKCPKCGKVEVPPYPVCNDCGSTDMEWVELSGDAELVTFSHSAMGSYPYTMDDVMCGWFRLAEGTLFCANVVNPPDDQEELMAKLPVKAKVEIICLEEENNIYFPAFRLLD